ncbi:CHY zinc finger domain-containing protein 1 [Seminavis robusta]|uniref:CHY zinc finger domain-containing protein 1 n=1 Tax=Seminavis robusta TaxID=568900 RepID=A0A9N8GZU2_9STRA|nr:CHY zinc finger domain-containing protein 1 [Seminavis robusta]|eukprot:Sro9_g007140.1 CHY zinc finger domain-containing protein 1 (229) ;mRNA; f:59699-60508
MILKNPHSPDSSHQASLSSTTEEQDTHHNIDRFAVKEIICRVCSARQSSKTNNCIKCGIQFGEYHCSVCNLWTSQEKQPFHCAGCGFCRVGGAENFHHCHDCAMCIRQSDYASHKCQNDKYKSNCPVCQKWLFNSLGDLHEMSCCGHPIHLECFQQLPDSSTCPVCLCQPQGTQAQPESDQTVDLLTQFRVLVSNPTLEVSTVSYFLELCKKDVEAAVALYLSQSQDM